MIWLRQSTASQEIPLGRFVDSTDGDTEETGLTIANTDIKLWKTGATTLASKNSGGATHIANGEYYCVLDATDTDTLGPMKVAVHVAGALAVQVFCLVLPAAVYDSLVLGTDTLPADMTQIGGDAQSATDLKDFADAGYDPGTNKVQGVVLTDTCTTNTDMRGTDSAATAGAQMDLVDAPNATAVTAIQSGLSTYAGGDTSGTTTLLSRLSAARAGYLDNLSAGAVATATKLLAYFQLLFRSDAAIETDNATELTAINADGGSGAGNYSAQTDSVEAIRDRGDSAWTTATGFMLSSEDGSSFTAVPWNASWDAEVQSECEDALAAHIVDATGATVSMDQALKEVRSAMAGDYVGSGSGPYAIAFKAKDGSTTLFTWTVAADGSTRSVA